MMTAADKLAELEHRRELALERRQDAYVNDVAMEKGRHKRKMAELASRAEIAIHAIHEGFAVERLRILGNQDRDEVQTKLSAERAVAGLQHG